MTSQHDQAHESCRSYNSGSWVCKDGFVQTPYCRGYASCHSCGHISDQLTPACLKDELPAHLVTESGRSIFAEPSNV